mmetsp:Transcript_43936/g.131713  ORF Transcript_43936/g.131713 Transcript_43936/m.131713 type:complete len:391 (+) Transcript_43936:2075-3247(+)
MAGAASGDAGEPCHPGAAAVFAPPAGRPAGTARGGRPAVAAALKAVPRDGASRGGLDCSAACACTRRAGRRAGACKAALAHRPAAARRRGAAGCADPPLRGREASARRYRPHVARAHRAQGGNMDRKAGPAGLQRAEEAIRRRHPDGRHMGERILPVCAVPRPAARRCQVAPDTAQGRWRQIHQGDRPPQWPRARGAGRGARVLRVPARHTHKLRARGVGHAPTCAARAATYPDAVLRLWDGPRRAAAGPDQGACRDVTGDQPDEDAVGQCANWRMAGGAAAAHFAHLPPMPRRVGRHPAHPGARHRGIPAPGPLVTRGCMQVAGARAPCRRQQRHRRCAAQVRIRGNAQIVRPVCKAGGAPHQAVPLGAAAAAPVGQNHFGGAGVWSAH